MSDTPTDRPNPDHPWVHSGSIPCLDGYRGLAILLVIFSHCAKYGGVPIPIPDEWRGQWSKVMIGLGDLGVSLFFILSGFLITLLLLREMHDTGGVSLKGFYTRRLLRIAPAWLLYLAFVAVLCATGTIHIDPAGWWAAATYTINMVGDRPTEFEHLWSLAVEEHFYLLWPPVLALVGPRRGLWVLVACIAISPVVRYLVSAKLLFGTDLHMGFSTPTRLDTIAWGCVLAFLCRAPWAARWAAVLNRYSIWLCGGAFALIAIAYAIPATFWKVWCFRTVSGLAIALIMYVSVVSWRRAPFSWLNWSVLRKVGAVSYGLYLWQQLFTVPSQLPDWVRAWPMGIILLITAAVGSYYLVERPVLRLKGNWGLKRSQLRVAVQ